MAPMSAGGEVSSSGANGNGMRNPVGLSWQWARRSVEIWKDILDVEVCIGGPDPEGPVAVYQSE
jgi:hypothetical protein